MRRRVALAVLVLSVVGTLLLHLRVERRDHSWLLRVDGVAYDVIGAATEAWHRSRRDCAGVDVVRAGSPGWDAALAAVAGYSPPDSGSARLVGVLASGEWRVAEARFDRLAPVVVALHRQDGRLQVVEQAVWSGSTWPWEPGPLIRRWLRDRAPGLPPALLACFDTSREAWSPRAIDAPR